jgi:tetratricopeptide (TPR) repeat protein
LEEALECLEQAVERFPDYTQARLSLVRMLAQLGRVEEAAAQLEELSGLVDVMPMVLLKSYYLAQITLYQTQERFQELEKVLNQLQDIDPDNEWAEQLLAILKTVNTFAPGGYFWEMKEQYRQKRFKQWGKVLSREANIINLVQLFTKEELYALLAAWHCSDNRSNLRKEEMKQLVLDLLIGDLTYPVKELLTYEDRVALNALLEFGGYTSYEEWQQKAGFEDTLLKESPYVSKLQLYQKLPGRLLNLGFVFIGQPEKTLVAAIPIDMRIRLKEALEAL